MYTLMITAKMNDINPQAWLADVLARIAAHLARGFNELISLELKKEPVVPLHWRHNHSPKSSLSLGIKD